MPVISFASLDLIPEGLRDSAEEKNGAFVIDVAPTKKVTEFRDRNIALTREKEELVPKLARYVALVGEDLDEATTTLTSMRTVAQQVKDGKLKGTSDIESEVANRTQASKEDFAKQLATAATATKAADEKAAKYESLYKASTRTNAVTLAAMAKDAGVNPQALPDIVARANGVFAVTDDGSLVPMKNGNVQYGADGVSPMSVSEWLKNLLVEAPYLGIGSAGGGASGSGGDQRFGGLSKDAFDKLTPQARLEMHRAATQKK